MDVNDPYYVFLSLMSNFSTLSTSTSDINIASEIIRRAHDPMNSFSISAIARNANVSEATVSRYIRTLYFHNYQDFRSKIGASFIDAQNHRNQSAEGKSLDEMLLNNYDTISADLLLTKKELNLSKLKKIVTAVMNAEKTVFIGRSEDIAPFYQFQLDLIANGIPCFFFYRISTQHEIMKQVDENTAIVFITPEIDYVKLYEPSIQDLAHHNAPVIAFTKNKHITNRHQFMYIYNYGYPTNPDSGMTCLKYLALCMSSILKEKVLRDQSDRR